MYPSVVRLSHTFRHAIRRLGRAPGFTAAALLTITLGIGATTTVFTVVNAVLLRPLPYPRADQLADLSHAHDLGRVTRRPVGRDVPLLPPRSAQLRGGRHLPHDRRERGPSRRRD